MTIFVYISRRPKVYGRPKQRLTTVVQPSNLSWKRALTRRWPRRRFLSKTLIGERRRRLRYSIAGPPASFVPTKRAFRIRIKRARRFIKTPKLYSIAGPPARFVPTRRMFRIRIKRGRHFVRTPRLYSIAGKPASFLPTKRAFKIRIKRGRRFLKVPRLYSIAGPPVGFVAQKRVLRPRIKRARFMKRPRPFPILLGLLLLYRKLPRLKLKRARTPFVRRRYSIAGPPAGFVPQKRMLRPRIKRVRLRVRSKMFPIVPSLLLLYRKLPRLKIRRWHSSLKPANKRVYSIAGPPASIVPHKRFPRAKIKRGKWNLQRFARRFYQFPGAVVATAKQLQTYFVTNVQRLMNRRGG